MTLGHLVFSTILIGLFLALLRYLQKKDHRCRYCRCSTVKVDDLPADDRRVALELIESEEMSTQDIESFDVCPQCRRIYDWRWFDDDRPFRRDWDMYDRQCRCGSDLRRPSYEYIGSEQLREAMKHLTQEAVDQIRGAYPAEQIMSVHKDLTLEDHIFFICIRCHRIYMWLPRRTFQVFQCVTRENTPYDDGPTRRETFSRGF